MAGNVDDEVTIDIPKEKQLLFFDEFTRGYPCQNTC